VSNDIEVETELSSLVVKELEQALDAKVALAIAAKISHPARCIVKELPAKINA
jgi:hypothetical protein